MPVSRLLRSPAVLRALAAIVAAVVALAVPQVLESALYLILALTAVAVGAVEVYGWWQSKRLRDLLLGLALMAGGLLLALGGDLADRLVEVTVALIILVRALVSLWGAYVTWRKTDEDPFWSMVAGLALLLLGSALLVVPDTFLRWVVFMIGAAWIIGGLIVLLDAIGAHEETPIPPDVVSVIREKSMDGPLRDQVTTVIFEGLGSHEGTLSFAALMSFATAIATFGVKADSTAVVIGAMLIAPLMSPIMALSASILMGWPDKAMLAGRRVAVGVMIGVGGAFLMSMISPEFSSITANSEVLSRTSPTILDLLIALAAGAAGGYAMTHPEVGNSLPGVAIAVALAPPLAVVGYSLEELEFGFALGAFLLFLTNLVGIIVAAGVAYIVSGYSPWSHLSERADQAKRSVALIAVSVGIVAVPLAIIGDGIIQQTTTRSAVNELVEDWLDDADYEVTRVHVTGDEYTVELIGSGALPDQQELADSIAEDQQENIELLVEVTPRTTTRLTGNGSRSDS